MLWYREVLFRIPCFWCSPDIGALGVPIISYPRRSPSRTITFASTSRTLIKLTYFTSVHGAEEQSPQTACGSVAETIDAAVNLAPGRRGPSTVPQRN
jgi:hypothetical protein